MAPLPAYPAFNWFPAGASNMSAGQAAITSPLLAGVHWAFERGGASCILCALYSRSSVSI